MMMIKKMFCGKTGKKTRFTYSPARAKTHLPPTGTWHVLRALKQKGVMYDSQLKVGRVKGYCVGIREVETDVV